MAINLITLDRPTSTEVRYLDSLNKALVLELLARSPRASAALLATVALLWMIVHPYTDELVGGLCIAITVLAVVRVLGAFWLKRRTPEHIPYLRVFYTFLGVSTLIGMSLGLLVILCFPSLPPLPVCMCAVCMISINYGAMVSFAGSPLVFQCYICGNVVAGVVVAFVYPLAGLEHTFQLTTIVFGVGLVILGRSVHRSLRNSIVLQLQLSASLAALRDAQAKLVDASRRAGRADVARAMLHNVGNVLNSVNVSTTVLRDRVVKSPLNRLSRVAALLAAHRDDLGAFFRDDPRGQQLPAYLTALGEAVERDNREVTAELASLTANIDHIRMIVRS